MPKYGILHDYDLMANEEPSTQGQTCVVCGVHPVGYQWSDYSGEAMCRQCGAPYQLKWGTDEQRKEGKYPYVNLKQKWIPVVRRYFDETHQFTCHGIMIIRSRPGLREFNKWVDAHKTDQDVADAINS